MTIVRSYSELITLPTFEERLAYLQTNQKPTDETFGRDRYLNQAFYTSSEWRRVRNQVIVRDKGLDLAVEGYPVHGAIFVHHINPITIEDLEHTLEKVLDPSFLITTSFHTHQMIHYGSKPKPMYVERKPGDTKLW